jgi:putative ABC transport system permease protein
MISFALEVIRVFKRLCRAPAFALAVIIIIALGIGTNTATMSLLYGYLLAPLPYPSADHLVNVYFTSRKIPGNLGMSYRTYFDLRAQTKGMSDAGMFKVENLNLSSGAKLAHVRGVEVSASLFTTLAVPPALGRVFGSRTDQPGAAREIVLSARLWSQLFDHSPAVLERTVTLNGHAYTVVGVMPRSFRFPDAQADLWLPKVFTAFDYEADNITALDDTMIARLAPGVSPMQMASRAQTVLDREIAHFPQSSAVPLFRTMGFRIDIIPLRAHLLGTLGERLVLAQLATALLLLLVWFNLANLFIARALTRRGELVTRRVIGADTSILFRELFAESLTLSLMGSLAGMALGELLVRVLLRTGFANTALAFPFQDWAAIAAIALALAMLSALVFSLAGLHFIRRQDLSQALREADARSTGGRREHRVRGALVVTQLALAFTLSGVGMLLVHSLINLDAVKLGFRTQHVITFQIQVPPGTGPTWKADLRARLTRLRAALLGLPGVQGATIASDVPFDGQNSARPVFPNPFESRHSPNVFPVVVDADYFRTLGIHLLAGRLFTPEDTASNAGDAVVDAEAARELFGTTAVVGRRFNFDAPNDSKPNVAFRIVGVVVDTRQEHLGSSKAEGIVYLDRDQVLQVDHTMWSWAPPNWYVAIRIPLSTAAILPLLSRTVATIFPGAPIYDVRSMGRRLSGRLAPRRAITVLVLMFALGALSVAAVGLYSVQSYVVGQRRPEFGLRAALGADRSRLRALVLHEAGWLLLLGSILGLCSVVVLGRSLSAALYRVPPFDPLSLILVLTCLGVITLLAGWLPARRASGIPPMEALRNR